MSDYAKAQENIAALKAQIDAMWALMTKDQIKKLEGAGTPHPAPAEVEPEKPEPAPEIKPVSRAHPEAKHR